MKKSTLFVSIALALSFVTTSCGKHAARIVDAGLDASDDGFVQAVDAMVDAARSDAGAQSGSGIDSRSGSRLTMRRVIYAGADGSQLDTGSTEVTDTLLGTTCSRSFAAMSDGSRRCVPSAFVNTAGAWTQFADAACTMPLIVTASACAPTSTSYVAVQETATCSGGSSTVLRMYHVGAVNGGGYYTKFGTGPCTAGTAQAGYTYYLVGAEAPPSDFVSMTTVP